MIEQQARDFNHPFVQLNAEPDPITVDISKTAILVVDMQNDFASPGGMFDLAGIDVSPIRQAIDPTARVLATARHVGIKVVYLKMGFRPDLGDLGAPNSPNHVRHLAFGVGQSVDAPDGRPSRILIRDTWNTDIVDELAPHEDDTVIYKHRYSGFYETSLDEILRQMGIQNLIVTGCTTSICVESTVRDAMFRDYACVLLADCMAEPIGQGMPRSNHEASLMLIQILFGWVSKADEVIAALESLAVTV